MRKLAIFDLDGTLVNSLDDLANAVNMALKQNGYEEHETAKYRYFVGDGTLTLIERVLPEQKRTDEIINKVHKEFSEIYNKNYLVNTRPYKGITEALEKLKEKGYILSVASNKPDKFTKEIVYSLFGDDVFDFVIGKRECSPKKPDPHIVYDIMSLAGAEKSETVMFGDTNVDMKTGKNAGIRTIGCLWGFREIDELRIAGADKIISSPDEIINAID